MLCLSCAGFLIEYAGTSFIVAAVIRFSKLNADNIGHSVFTLTTSRYVVGLADLNMSKLWYRTDIEALFTFPNPLDCYLLPAHNVAYVIASGSSPNNADISPGYNIALNNRKSQPLLYSSKKTLIMTS
jgi:hypothetical protein